VLATLLRHMCIPTPYVYQHIMNMAEIDRLHDSHGKEDTQCTCCIACINWIRRLEIAASPVIEMRQDIYKSLYAASSEDACTNEEGEEAVAAVVVDWRTQCEDDAGPRLQVCASKHLFPVIFDQFLNKGYLTKNSYLSHSILGRCADAAAAQLYTTTGVHPETPLWSLLWAQRLALLVT
jgi:hypothetical protein